MHRRTDPSPALLTLARLQADVVTTEQVAGHGLGRHAVARLIDQGLWSRLGTGLYYASPVSPPSWLALAWGGTLLGGSEARLGGLAAGHVVGLNDPPDTIDVLIPERSVLKSRGSWRFVRERPLVRSPRSYGGPPRLSVEDTVLDLTEKATSTEIIDLVTKAVQNRLTTADRLLRSLERRPRHRHRRMLVDLLAEVREGAESPLEVRYARDVERAHGLPRGLRQQKSRRGKDYRDVTYEEFGVVVELDGRRGHEGVGRFRDMRRDNAAILGGEIPLRYGWHDVCDRHCAVAFEVGTVLMRRGWTDLPTRCPHCLNATDLDIA